MVLLEDARNLADSEECQPKIQQESLLSKYGIPVQHLDFDYVEKCNEGRELEKIVQILRSGEEGYYPDLTKAAESRLAVIKPKSKFLRTACPVISKESLSKEEQNELNHDLKKWISSVSENDNKLDKYKTRNLDKSQLPEVREIKEKLIVEKEKSNTKRIKSTDYSSWDKYDADTEILKMDLKEEKVKKAFIESKKKKTNIKKTVQFEKFQTDIEALHEANYEKDKGNEFFKAGDYKEALRYYTNSINYKPTLAGFTNRALTNIKLNKYQNAIDDCNSALSIEPNNIKALVRKSQALEGLKRYRQALETVEEVIGIDPNNTVAQELADKCRRQSGVVMKNKRFLVEEVESKRDNKQVTKSEIKKQVVKKKGKDKQKVIIPIPGTSNMEPPYYVVCPENSLQKVKETLKANTPPQILHLVPLDNSDADDDDGCTINHLDKTCDEADYETISQNSCKKSPLNNFSVPKNKECEYDLNAANNFGREKNRKNYSSTTNNITCTEEHLNTSYILKNGRVEHGTNMANNSKNIEDKENSWDRSEMKVESAIKKVKKQIVNDDKRAGGEPFTKESHIEVPDDIHSPYSFLKTWNSASGDTTLEQHAAILRSIDMSRIVNVIGCKLDNTMFSTIIKCLCYHFAVPGEVDRLHFILESIVNLPRFEIISMLMSQEDKKFLNVLINFLKQHEKCLREEIINKLFSN